MPLPTENLAKRAIHERYLHIQLDILEERQDALLYGLARRQPLPQNVPSQRNAARELEENIETIKGIEKKLPVETVMVL